MGRRVSIALAAAGAVVATSTGAALIGGAHAASTPPVGRVAHRVERLRGLKFKYVPKVEVVAAKDLAKAVGRGEEKKPTPSEQRQALAAEGAAALAGILRTQDVSRQGGAGGGAGDVEGVYVPQRKRIYLVREAIGRSDKEAEIVLAHELTHALEDQHFHDFTSGGAGEFSDNASALHALLEGSATLTELRYAQRYLHAPGSLQQLMDKRARGFAAAKVSPALRDAAAFPYIDGGRFVEALHARGGWKLVGFAHRHPPRTTEAILHPQGWHGTDRQKRPRFKADGALGGDWERLGRADVGEMDTAELLRVGLAEADARRGAAGWDAGAFETWARKGADLKKCRLPCRTVLATVMAWRWDTPKDAQEFAQLAQRAIAHGLGGKRAKGVFGLKGGGAAVKLYAGRRTALAYAPTAQQALTLIKAASNG